MTLEEGTDKASVLGETMYAKTMHCHSEGPLASHVTEESPAAAQPHKPDQPQEARPAAKGPPSGPQAPQEAPKPSPAVAEPAVATTKPHASPPLHSHVSSMEYYSSGQAAKEPLDDDSSTKYTVYICPRAIRLNTIRSTKIL